MKLKNNKIDDILYFKPVIHLGERVNVNSYLYPNLIYRLDHLMLKKKILNSMYQLLKH